MDQSSSDLLCGEDFKFSHSFAHNLVRKNLITVKGILNKQTRDKLFK